MWPVITAFQSVPTLILRGELSDLFSAKTAARMKKEIGDSAEVVTVPQVGHAPTLDEPEAIAATERLLKRIIANGG